MAGNRGFDGGYRRWRASQRHAALLIEQPAWLERQLHIYQSAAAAVNHDDPALADLADEGRRWQSWHALTRRVVITARHRTR